MTNLDVSPDHLPQPQATVGTERESILEPVSVPEPAPEPAAREDEVETSPERSGPPSESSSQDWDRLTDTGSQIVN